MTRVSIALTVASIVAPVPVVVASPVMAVGNAPTVVNEITDERVVPSLLVALMRTKY